MWQTHRKALQDDSFRRLIGIANGAAIGFAPRLYVARVNGHHRNGGLDRDFGENLRYGIAIDGQGLVAFFVFHENAARFLSHAPLPGVPPGSKVF
jgi:hypothetical protein